MLVPGRSNDLRRGSIGDHIGQTEVRRMNRGKRRHRFIGRVGALAGTFLILSTLMLTAGAAIAIAADTGAKPPQTPEQATFDNF